MGKLIQVGRAAEQIGVSRQTIENWGAKGMLNIFEVGHIHYVECDVINRLSTELSEIEKAEKELRTAREKMDAERMEIERSYYDGRWRRRCTALCSASSLRSGLFRVVINLLVMDRRISQRDGDVAMRVLNGDDISVIAEDYGFTSERVRQIAKEIIRKSKNLESLERRITDAYAIVDNIKILNARVAELESQIVTQEAEKIQLREDWMNEILKNDAVLSIFNTKLSDCGLSIRTMNALNGYVMQFPGGAVNVPIVTLGDLVRHSKMEILNLKNAGQKTVAELEEVVSRHGLKWKMDVDGIMKKREEMLNEKNKTK